MNTRRAQAGMTLIEVLIAVTLVSLLSVGILMAIRTGLNSMGKTNDRLMANRKSLGAQMVLEQQIAGFMPVFGDCVSAPGAPRTRIPFFQGEAQTMRFVSTFSLDEAHRGAPRLLEFQVIAGANNEGVRLVVNEHLYVGPLGAGQYCLGRSIDPVTGVMAPVFPPVQIGPGSFVLADRLAACSFSYRLAMPPPVFERWEARWLRKEWPTAIRIEMAPLELNPGKVPLVSLTVPLRAQKDPGLEYVNQPQ
jgi:general secretion pathway protein J